MEDNDSSKNVDKTSPRGLLPILGIVFLSVVALISSYQHLAPISSSYRASFQHSQHENVVKVVFRSVSTSARDTDESPLSKDALVHDSVSIVSNSTRADVELGMENRTTGTIERHISSESRSVDRHVTKDVTNTTTTANFSATFPIHTVHVKNTATPQSDNPTTNDTVPDITLWTRTPLTSLKQSKFFVTRKVGTGGHPGLFELLNADFRVCDDLDRCPTSNTATKETPSTHPVFNNETTIRIFFEPIDKSAKMHRKPEARNFLAVTYYEKNTRHHVPFIIKEDLEDKETSRLQVHLCGGQGCPKDCSDKQKETNSSFPYFWDAHDGLCRSSNPFFLEKYSDGYACGCKSVCFTPGAVEDTDEARYWPWQNKSERDLYIRDDATTQQRIAKLIRKGKAIRTYHQKFSEHIPRFDCQNATTKVPLPLWAGFDHHLLFFPQAKLIFCGIPKAGITEWNSFLRFVNGAKDYLGRPHDKQDRFEFLLSSMTPERASELLLDPSWTKATFFRDPAERLLSSYLNKVVNEGYTETAFKIGDGGDPNNKAMLTFEEFVGLVTMPSNFVNGTLNNIPIGHGLHAKTDPHWRPQSMMCGLDFLLPHFDFVGNFNFVSQQTKLLLERVGLWNDYGSKFDDGSGDYKVGHLCSKRLKTFGDPGYNSSRVVYGFNQREITGLHATNAKEKLAKYYTPSLLERVRKAYALDFAIFDEIQSRAEDNVYSVASGKDLKVVQTHCRKIT